MIAVIGSQATSLKVDLKRSLMDIDFVGKYDDIVSLFKRKGATGIRPFDEGKKMLAKGPQMMYEAEVAWDGSTSEALLALIAADPDTIKSDLDPSIVFASLDMCYMLKMTHRFKKNSPHFLKTMRDIHIMRQSGAKIRDDHRDFYERRLKETLSYGHPKLNQNKKDFFTDSVPYVYDHDTIHLTVAKFGKPAYSFYKPDDNEVYCSKEMFDAQTEEIRLAGVYEEACVLALERSQIPYPETDPKASFDKALEKVCTSITSGWFREFAWENYGKIQVMYHAETFANRNYVSLFHEGLARGIVKPHAN